MNPKLIVISGPSQGATFELTETEVFIGREAVNQVCIVDPSISRRHASIKRAAEGFKVSDLESLNGTFVNDVPVSERLLKHGDRIAIGDVMVLFLLHDADGEVPHPAVSFDEQELATQSLVKLGRQDVLYFAEDKLLAVLPPQDRLARYLYALLKISTVVNSTPGFAEMQQRLLELIFEVVPAERGAILLKGESPEDLVPSAARTRDSNSGESIRVSRTVAVQTMRERLSILIDDVSSDSSFANAESLVASHIRAIISAPLVVHDEVQGIIYLDTRDASVTLDEHHLQLLTAIASIAAMAIENMRNAERLEDENLRLSEELNIKHTMIGDSPRMRELYRFIAKVAPADATVMLRGESGTGKELAARAVHTNGARAKGPFVAINCATLNETLLESELFGHEKGAFTGAVALKRGKLEIADGGTLFLDEVAELSLNIQAKLLRVLQEREFERVGGTRPIKVDLRVVAATNRDLEADVRNGAFRQDLYYRLNVISFVLPPLRERREDIPLLANYFAAESSKRARRRTVRISPEARSYLIGYSWPGNVRELENVIERAVVLGSIDVVLPEDLPESILEGAASGGIHSTKFYDALREAKKRLILDALKQATGNHNEAARQLGVHPNNLHRLIRNMNIKDSIGK
jgi:transcriptional regulator with GAF, ATPase, and Fis domain